MKTFAVILTILCALGCSWEQKGRSSVLVIAVESLGFDDIPCDSFLEDSPDISGFAWICSESVRFTHVYTPSTLSVPALASIMTGKYPFEHGLRDNGSSYLKATEVNLSEMALDNNYRTGFFSGGPPVFRKSGLNQGFEKFEDQILPALHRPYFPALKTMDRFLDWLDEDVGGSPFFATIYLPDLQFPSVATQSDEGLARGRFFESQLSELSESLEALIAALRKQGRWDSSVVVLVGLNGHGRKGESDFEPLELRSPNTHVALLIKPPSSNRDRGLNWKVDDYLSLVDLGATLRDLVAGETPPLRTHALKVRSFLPALSAPRALLREPVPILIESYWPQWKFGAGIRFAVRKENRLVVYDEKPKLFNTLVDRWESVPVPLGRGELESEGWPSLVELSDLGLPLWRGLKMAKVFSMVHGYWREPESKGIDQLYSAAKRTDLEGLVAGWWARQMIDEKNWPGLLELGRNESQALWQFVAAKNLGIPFALKLRGCERFFIHQPNQFRGRECQDRDFVRLLEWERERNPDARFERRENFLKNYAVLVLGQKIRQYHYSAGLTWDVSHDYESDLSLVELYLALPGRERFKEAVTSYFGRRIN